jgi:hypothetical protein
LLTARAELKQEQDRGAARPDASASVKAQPADHSPARLLTQVSATDCEGIRDCDRIIGSDSL